MPNLKATLSARKFCAPLFLYLPPQPTAPFHSSSFLLLFSRGTFSSLLLIIQRYCSAFLCKVVKQRLRKIAAFLVDAHFCGVSIWRLTFVISSPVSSVKMLEDADQ